MGLKFTNQREVFDNLEETIKEIARSNKVQKAVAQEVVEVIRERTESGKDIRRTNFKPYSTKPMYMSKNSKYNPERVQPRGGRKTKNDKSVFYKGGYKQYKQQTHGKSKPDLTNTGTMLSAMRYKFSGSKITVYIQNVKNRAVIGLMHDKGLGRLKRRQWFGIKAIKDQVAVRKVWEKSAGIILKRRGWTK